MITLAPEDSDKTFQVPRVLLTTASSWFEKALDERFKEGQDRVLKLLDTDTETIENFLYWLYHRQSPFSRSSTNCTNDNGIEVETHRAAVIRFWAFGDKHFIPRIQAIAMAALNRSMSDGSNSWPSIGTIKLGYTLSPAGSPLRLLFSQICTAGLIANEAPPPKKRRRRHERLPSSAVSKVAGPEGYALADFEQVEDTPGLLIDILRGFVSPSSSDDAIARRESLGEYLRRTSRSSETGDSA